MASRSVSDNVAGSSAGAHRADGDEDTLTSSLPLNTNTAYPRLEEGRPEYSPPDAPSIARPPSGQRTTSSSTSTSVVGICGPDQQLLARGSPTPLQEVRRLGREMELNNTFSRELMERIKKLRDDAEQDMLEIDTKIHNIDLWRRKMKELNEETARQQEESQSNWVKNIQRMETNQGQLRDSMRAASGERDQLARWNLEQHRENELKQAENDQMNRKLRDDLTSCENRVTALENFMQKAMKSQREDRIDEPQASAKMDGVMTSQPQASAEMDGVLTSQSVQLEEAVAGLGTVPMVQVTAEQERHKLAITAIIEQSNFVEALKLSKDPIGAVAWKEVGKIPQDAVNIQQPVVHNDRVIIVGQNGRTKKLTAWCASIIALDRWETYDDLPPCPEGSTISWFSYVSTPIALYSFVQFEKKTELFQQAATDGYDRNNWVRICSIPVPKIDFAAQVINGCLVVVGGTVDGTLQHKAEYLEFPTPETGRHTMPKWKPLVDLKHKSRGGSLHFVCEGASGWIIYSGFSQSRSSARCPAQKLPADMLKIRTRTSWANHTPALEIHHNTLAAVNNRLVSVGGVPLKKKFGHTAKECYVLDRGTWIASPPLRHVRENALLMPIAGSLFCFAGQHPSNASEVREIEEWKYEPKEAGGND